MYVYDKFDNSLVSDRVEQFREQVGRTWILLASLGPRRIALLCHVVVQPLVSACWTALSLIITSKSTKAGCGACHD